MNAKTEMNLEELKQCELNILIKFDKICREQGFRYSLIGGTLLGAVRHEGFIPWDDDIDVGMPRPDYEKFLDYCHNNCQNLFVVSNKYNPNFGYLFAKICDPNTYIVEKTLNRFNTKTGVYVDIFPIDGIGDTYKQSLKNFDKSEFSRELLVACNWKKFVKSKTHSLLLEPVRFLFYLLSRFVSISKLTKKTELKLKSIKFDESNYAGIICGVYRKREILERPLFENYVLFDFEGHKFYGFKDYDVYLKSLYGDYMKLPPVDKQITHHEFSAFYCDNI